MKHLLSASLFAATATFASFGAIADTAPKAKFGVDACLAAVLAKQAGEPLQVTLKVEGKEPSWEFEIEAKDGKFWDIECSGATGKVTEVEQRVKAADDPLFKAKAKVGEDEARKTALAKYPGEIERTEYEIESDGKVSYEFDIKLKSGGDMRVEVDAGSGAIVEASREVFEIGRLPK
jgi:uncharacterized membrane protein YkoI